MFFKVRKMRGIFDSFRRRPKTAYFTHQGLRAEMTWQLMPKTIDENGVHEKYFEVRASLTNTTARDLKFAQASFTHNKLLQCAPLKAGQTVTLRQGDKISDQEKGPFPVVFSRKELAGVGRLVGVWGNGVQFDTEKFHNKSLRGLVRFGVFALALASIYSLYQGGKKIEVSPRVSQHPSVQVVDGKRIIDSMGPVIRASELDNIKTKDPKESLKRKQRDIEIMKAVKAIKAKAYGSKANGPTNG